MARTPVQARRSGTRAGLVAITAMAPVVWGSTYLVTTHALPPDHPMFAGATRALPAGLLAIAIARELPQGSWWWRSMVIGTLNIGIFFPLLFVAAERLPGGVAATFGAVQPLAVVGLSVALLDVAATKWRVGWGVTGLVGVTMVVLGPGAALDGVGLAAALGGALSMAAGVTLAKRWGRPSGVSAIGFAGWQLTAGGIALLPVALLEGPPGHIDPAGAAGYLWLGLIGGLAAYTAWFSGIARLPASSVAMLGLLSPLVAAGLGAALVGERFVPLQLAGFTLALLAILGSQLPEPTGATRRSSPRELLRKEVTS